MQYFIKVGQTYTPKNKLHRLILYELKSLDCTLYPNHGMAKKAIKHSYKQAMDAYSGTAKKPYSIFYNKDLGYSVPGVAILNLYPVKNS